MTNPNDGKALTPKEAVEKVGSIINDQVHAMRSHASVYCSDRESGQMRSEAEFLAEALATLEALAEENEKVKAGDEDILVKAKELSIEVDTAVEKAKGYKSRAEKAEAELTQKTKDYDWMTAQRDVWMVCSFKEANLKDGFKAELARNRPLIEAARGVDKKLAIKTLRRLYHPMFQEKGRPISVSIFDSIMPILEAIPEENK